MPWWLGIVREPVTRERESECYAMVARRLGPRTIVELNTLINRATANKI